MAAAPPYTVTAAVSNFLGAAPTLEEIGAFKLPETLEERVLELLEPNRSGQLAAVERDELDEFTRMYDKMVKKLAAEFGIDFATHTFRWTAITEWLPMRTPPHEVQAQAGHADSSTTTKYTQAGDARQRRESFKTRGE